jgi:hypothetical protein
MAEADIDVFAASTSERRSPSSTVPERRSEDRRLELSGARSPAHMVSCLLEERREGESG